MEKLDATLPNIVFSGRDDLYLTLRETREYCNSLKEENIALGNRIQALELLLKDTIVCNGTDQTQYFLSKDNVMANTQSIQALRPTRVSKRGKKK